MSTTRRRRDYPSLAMLAAALIASVLLPFDIVPTKSLAAIIGGLICGVFFQQLRIVQTLLALAESSLPITTKVLYHQKEIWNQARSLLATATHGAVIYDTSSFRNEDDYELQIWTLLNRDVHLIRFICAGSQHSLSDFIHVPPPAPMTHSGRLTLHHVPVIVPVDLLIVEVDRANAVIMGFKAHGNYKAAVLSEDQEIVREVRSCMINALEEAARRHREQEGKTCPLCGEIAALQASLHQTPTIPS